MAELLIDPADAPEFPGEPDEDVLLDATDAPEFPGEIHTVGIVDMVLNKAKAICAAVGGSAAYEAASFIPEGPVKHWVQGVGIPAAAALGAYLARNRGQINVLASDAVDTFGKHSA